ncbi:ABC-2 type transport system permease protein [Natrinema hispanicum]|uniref:ABC-2 type transport system permease protein n=1 Tax=Natrinema hispanicum TaxID=392421 RepID=A0A482Y7F4_9EURY|nr:ABC transporter permease subunit [Natrinema hispanicum]RZV06115.1 ABC-2 type transport system permease protein [Natrinema hispanicum]
MTHSRDRGGSSSRRALGRFALYVREDVRDSVRERQAHILGTLFVLIGFGIAYTTGRAVARAPPAAEIGLMSRLVGPLRLLIPLVTLGAVAVALVEKRMSGELTVLLGLPFSRLVVVLGTLVGRSIVISAAVLSSLLVALLVALVMGVPVDLVQFTGAAIGLVALAITFTAIAVSISAVTRTSARATFVAFGVYVLFALQIWGNLPMTILYVSHGFTLPETIPQWVEFVQALNPMTAFSNGLGVVFPSLTEGAPGLISTDPALYERPAFVVCILAAWIVVAVALGYRQFRTSDI